MTRRFAIVTLAGVCLLCFFWNLGGNGLFDLDEALYANCAREMVLTGDYVVPHVNREPFFEKPPLVYWAAAAFYRVLGRSELTTRLPSALGSLIVVILVWRFGRRFFGERAGLLAAYFFALSPMVFGAARQLTTDATLNLCIAGSLLSWYRARSSGDNRWYLLFWAGMGFGVLAKGLPGVLIPVATVVCYLVFRDRSLPSGEMEQAGVLPPADPEARSTRPDAFWMHIAGLLLLLAIGVPWHILAYRAAGNAFVSEYIIRQHLARFRGGDTSHLAPFWFFVPGFLVGAFPWSFFVPPAFLSHCNGDGSAPRANFRRFLKVWAALVFLMFSASGTKLISYILPMYPPAALLAGDWCARMMQDKPRRLAAWMLPAVLLSLLFVAVIAFSGPIIHAVEASTHRSVRMDQVPDGVLRWAGHLFACAAAATGAFAVLLAGKRTKSAFGALAAGMALFYLVAVFEGLPLIDRSLLRPLHEMARQAGDGKLSGGAPIVVKTGGARRPSALFYLPDDRFTRNRDNPPVIETTDLNRVEAEMRRHARAVVLIDRPSAAKIPPELAGLTTDQNSDWVVLYYSR